MLGFYYIIPCACLATSPVRQVLLYGLKGSELVNAGERIAPDAVAALTWLGPSSLLVATRKAYFLMNTATGAHA